MEQYLVIYNKTYPVRNKISVPTLGGRKVIFKIEVDKLAENGATICINGDVYPNTKYLELTTTDNTKIIYSLEEATAMLSSAILGRMILGRD